MERHEFIRARKKLGRTQKQMASLLGASLKAVQGYEQGWRKIPVHVERQLFFLIHMSTAESARRKPCWVTKKCPIDRRDKCPAWEFKAGEICWFINGTTCEGIEQKDWHEKMKICRSCEVLISLLEF
ncbi:MAG: transcriptional regulator [Deltaproteobacteria bacterium]|nr:transcriptional regulator [Deltaproteobacteria bacterium]